MITSVVLKWSCMHSFVMGLH